MNEIQARAWLAPLARRLRRAWDAYGHVGTGDLLDPQDPQAAPWRLILGRAEWAMARAMWRLGLEAVQVDGWHYHRDGGRICSLRLVGAWPTHPVEGSTRDGEGRPA